MPKISLANILDSVESRATVLHEFADIHPEINCSDLKEIEVFLTDLARAMTPQFRELLISAEDFAEFEPKQDEGPRETEEGYFDTLSRFKDAYKEVELDSFRRFLEWKQQYESEHGFF